MPTFPNKINRFNENPRFSATSSHFQPISLGKSKCLSTLYGAVFFTLKSMGLSIFPPTNPHFCRLRKKINELPRKPTVRGLFRTVLANFPVGIRGLQRLRTSTSGYFPNEIILFNENCTSRHSGTDSFHQENQRTIGRVTRHTHLVFCRFSQ